MYYYYYFPEKKNAAHIPCAHKCALLDHVVHNDHRLGVSVVHQQGYLAPTYPATHRWLGSVHGGGQPRTTSWLSLSVPTPRSSADSAAAWCVACNSVRSIKHGSPAQHISGFVVGMQHLHRRCPMCDHQGPSGGLLLCTSWFHYGVDTCLQTHLHSVDA